MFTQEEITLIKEMLVKYKTDKDLELENQKQLLLNNKIDIELAKIGELYEDSLKTQDIEERKALMEQMTLEANQKRQEIIADKENILLSLTNKQL